MLPSLQSCEEYLIQRFGVEEIFENFKLVERSGDFWIVPKNMNVEGEYITTGIRALRDTGIGLKPTTYFLQWLGNRITKNKLEMDKEILDRLVFDREVLTEFSGITNGYVALMYKGEVLGCGLKKNSGLVTQIPKGRAKMLKNILDDL